MVAPRFPIMSGSATLTMLVSISSRIIASITAKSTITRRKPRRNSSSGTAAGSGVTDTDAHQGGEAHRQPPRVERRAAVAILVAGVDRDANWHALHDLGEVARGVVRRDQRVLGAGGGRERFHVTPAAVARERIDLHERDVAHLHPAD